jgi:hypothetical protein
MNRYILVLKNGKHLFPLEKIGSFGEIVFGLTREKSYDAANDWPLLGLPGSKRVASELALAQLKVPFRYKSVPRQQS